MVTSGPRIYIASKSKHGPRWLALRATHNIVSTWIGLIAAASDWWAYS